jgi:hypothetical protein
MYAITGDPFRHDWAWFGHPRRLFLSEPKMWMAAAMAAMT